MTTSPNPEQRPLSDRARDWLFRLLFAQAVNKKPPQAVVADLHHCFTHSEQEWAALEPTSPYRPDLRDGHINETVWKRIEPQVVESLDGITSHKEQLETAIRQASPRWRLDRMPLVDRLVLTIGCYELLVSRARPARRVINRTVELAKRFGEENSRRFVNGILDQIRNVSPAQPCD